MTLKRREPLSTTSEWTFDLLDTYNHEIGRIAKDFNLDTYPNQIEVISAERVPLPITETGYKSLFIPPERIAEFGSATDYVLAWLDHAAEAESWKGREAEARQLSLF